MRNGKAVRNAAGFGSVGDGLRAVATELEARAREVEAGAALLLKMSALFDATGDAKTVSRTLAASLLGIGAPGPFEGPESRTNRPRMTAIPTPPAGGRIGDRLFDQVGLVVIEAATVCTGKRTGLCALGIERDGQKHVLSYLWDVTSSQEEAGKALVEDLYRRGVGAGTDAPLLWLTDGGRGLDAAIRRRYPQARIGLSAEAFRKKVLAHLRTAPNEQEIRSELDRALRLSDQDALRQKLERLSQSFSLSHPGSALSIREGLPGLLVLPSLEPSPALFRSLASSPTLRTAISTSLRLGQREACEGEDPMEKGVRAFEATTRRLIGCEDLEALLTSLRTQACAA